MAPGGSTMPWTEAAHGTWVQLSSGRTTSNARLPSLTIARMQSPECAASSGRRLVPAILRELSTRLSRGPVLDGKALADALQRGDLAGAAVDVYDPEPPPPDHPLLSAPNCVLTPHIGARSREGLAAMHDVVDDVIGVLAGRPPVYQADPELC